MTVRFTSFAQADLYGVETDFKTFYEDQLLQRSFLPILLSKQKLLLVS